MPEQKLTWDKFPDKIKKLAETLDEHWGIDPWCIAMDIMKVAKPELEKAFKEGIRLAQEDERNQGFIYKMKGLDDFETWYQNTYLK